MVAHLWVAEAPHGVDEVAAVHGRPPTPLHVDLVHQSAQAGRPVAAPRVQRWLGGRRRGRGGGGEGGNGETLGSRLGKTHLSTRTQNPHTYPTFPHSNVPPSQLTRLRSSSMAEVLSPSSSLAGEYVRRGEKGAGSRSWARVACSCRARNATKASVQSS